MAIVYDKDMGRMPIGEFLNEAYYRMNCFKYKGIFQFHTQEWEICEDIDDFSLKGVDFSNRAFVIFKRNARSRVISWDVMDWMAMRIGARLLLQSEIRWCDTDDSKMKKHELHIYIIIPVIEKNVV